MRSGPRALLIGALAALTLSSAHPADASDTRMVIESYVGPRPAESAQAMSYLQTALERWEFTARPAAVIQQLGAHVVSPGSRIRGSPPRPSRSRWRQG